MTTKLAGASYGWFGFLVLFISIIPSSAQGVDAMNWDLETPSISRWRVAFGGHNATRKLRADQAKKNDAALTVKNIGDVPPDRGSKILGWGIASYTLDGGDFFEFEYYKTTIDEVGTIRKNAKVFGIPLRLGLRMPISLETESFKIRYGYPLFSTERLNVSGTLGVREFRASVTYPHEDFRRYPDDYKIVLPTFGVLSTYTMGKNWRGVARADWLTFSANGSTATIADFDGVIEYSGLSGNVIGVGYRYSLITYAADRERWSGHLSYRVRGPLIYAAVNF